MVPVFIFNHVCVRDMEGSKVVMWYREPVTRTCSEYFGYFPKIVEAKRTSWLADHHYVITRRLPTASRHSKSDENFDTSIFNIVFDISVLSGPYIILSDSKMLLPIFV